MKGRLQYLRAGPDPGAWTARMYKLANVTRRRREGWRLYQISSRTAAIPSCCGAIRPCRTCTPRPDELQTTLGLEPRSGSLNDHLPQAPPRA